MVASLRTKGHWFESRQGVRFLGLNAVIWNLICVVVVFLSEIDVKNIVFRKALSLNFDRSRGEFLGRSRVRLPGSLHSRAASTRWKTFPALRRRRKSG
jgi:hypothetical protein